jgi:hypothetical protein
MKRMAQTGARRNTSPLINKIVDSTAIHRADNHKCRVTNWRYGVSCPLTMTTLLSAAAGFSTRA